MKKLLSLLLAALLLISTATACVVINDPNADTKEEEPLPGEAGEQVPEDEETSEEESSTDEEDAKFDMESFLTNLAEEHPGATPAELTAEILKDPYFTLFNEADTSYYYPGLPYDYTPEGIKECSCIYDWVTNSGALIYIMTAEDGTDPAALVKAFVDNADPQWLDFDGTGLDGMVSGVIGGKAIFAMYDTAMQPVTGKIAEKARDFVDIFHEYLAENPDATCLELVEYFNLHQKFNTLYTLPIEEGKLTGFGELGGDTEITGFADGAGLVPMMSPNLFICYIFELPDDADMGAFVAQLEDNANLAWNVCMVANTVITDTDGNKVLFMMCAEGESPWNQ